MKRSRDPLLFRQRPRNDSGILASVHTPKPRPHQQQCRSNIVECYKSNDSFDKVERCFDIVAGVHGAL